MVKVRAAGICGSELHAFTGASERRTPPLLMGHEFSGEAAKVGDDVMGIEVGDRVAIEPIITCGVCKQCRSSRANVCANRKLIGLHTPGAFAEYVAVPATNCHKIPDDLSFNDATFGEPLANAVRAVNQAHLRVGDHLLILGSGVIGLLTVQVARLHTGGRIIATDVVDEKLELARKYGADFVINAEKEDVVKKVMEITDGLGVDNSIEIVGHEHTVKQAISSTARGGTVVVVGLMQQLMELDMIEIVTKENKLEGHYGYTSFEYGTALQLMTSGSIDVKPLLSKTVSLDRIVEGFEAMAAQKAMKFVINP